MDLSLNLTDTHVLITGGVGAIGKVVVEAFLAAGARVTSLDIVVEGDRHPRPGLFETQCDIADEEQVAKAFQRANDVYGMVHCCVALASLDLGVLEHNSIADASYEQMKRVLDINVAGTWLTAREWIRGLRAMNGKGDKEDNKIAKNVGLIIVGSESGWFGERGNADYAMGKSAVQGGLLASLKADIPRIWEGARVNAIAPGPVDTDKFKEECRENLEQYWLDCQATTALHKPIPPESVAKTILFLASENFSGHIHGQVLNVDSGKQGKVMWTKEESTRFQT